MCEKCVRHFGVKIDTFTTLSNYINRGVHQHNRLTTFHRCQKCQHFILVDCHIIVQLWNTFEFVPAIRTLLCFNLLHDIVKLVANLRDVCAVDIIVCGAIKNVGHIALNIGDRFC